jgi:hypothetical protein
MNRSCSANVLTRRLQITTLDFKLARMLKRRTTQKAKHGNVAGQKPGNNDRSMYGLRMRGDFVIENSANCCDQRSQSTATR